MEPYGKLFEKFKNDFSNAINNHFIKNQITREDIQQLEFFTSLLSSHIKRKEWSSEKEWRIICISQGAFHESIIGDLNNGKTRVCLENKTPKTLKLFTNYEHNRMATKDILKLGSNAGNKEDIKYIIELLLKKQTGINCILRNISKSSIQTR